ncbi:MAG: hypothetical protein ACP5H8_01170 [Candidatus Micrarchaeia archaeon]
MVVDDNVKSIIMKKIEEWGDQPVNVARLSELRELITKKTGKHKFLPYNNLKKWVRDVKKEMRAMSKSKQTTSATTKALQVPAQPQAQARQEQLVPRPAPQPVAVMSPFADRVYFQNLGYELSSMRRALERISKQLDELEAQLKEFRKSTEEEQE